MAESKNMFLQSRMNKDVDERILPNGEYRDAQKNKGDFVVDLRAQYHFSDKFTLGFICKNVLNNDYQLRPAKPDAPRSFTFQGKFTF